MPDLKKLLNLRITEVSGVDKAANKRRFLVVKRAEEDPLKGGGNTDDQKLTEKAVSFLKGILDRITKGAGDAKDFASLLGERQREEAMWDMTYAFRESLDSILGDPEVTDKKTAIANTLQQFFIALTASNLVKGEKIDIAKVGRKISQSRMDMIKQMKDMLEKLIADAEVVPDVPEGAGVNKNQGGNNVPEKITMDMLPEEVVKALNAIPDLTKQAAKSTELETKLTETVTKLDATNVELKKAQEDLAKAQEDQRKQEFITKAAGLKNLATNAEELGLLMKAVAENKATPEQIAKLEGILKAADEGIAKGNLFGEIGRSGGGTVAGSALAKAEAFANEMIQKNAAMTREQAMAKVWIDNPQLYAQYEKEERASRRDE